MIGREKLDAVETIVAHKYAGKPCPDGVASAIILHDALPDARILFVTHGPELDNLPAEPGMLFVDIAPPRHRAKEFVSAGALVLDHHEKQKDVVEMFGANGFYGDLATEPGVSGAMLAFREVWMATTVGEMTRAASRALYFARLAGVRDTWQTEHPEWRLACAQAEALAFYPWEKFAGISEPFGGDGWNRLDGLIGIGGVLLERRAEQVKRSIESAMGLETQKGTQVMIVSTLDTSDVAEAVGAQADLVVGFEYRGGETALITLSTRSRAGFDAGAFCASLGGGGHRSAAGATLPVTSGDLNPYRYIMKLVDDFEHGKALGDPPPDAPLPFPWSPPQ